MRKIENEALDPSKVKAPKMNNTTDSDIRANDLYSPAYIWCSVVFNILLLVFICGGNIFTIIIQRRKTMTNKITNRLVMNLACADLMVGVTAPTRAVLFAVNDVQAYKFFCLIQDACASIAMGVSLYSVMLIALERYMGICHPLKRQRWVTVCRLQWCTIAVWLYISVTVALVFSFQDYQAGMPCLMSFYLPIWIYEGAVCSNVIFVIVVTCSLYTRIFYIAKTSQTKVILYKPNNIPLKPFTEPIAAANPHNDNLLGNVHGHTIVPKQQAMKFNIVMAMVIGAVIITWIPFMVVSTLRVSVKGTSSSWIMAEETTMLLSAINSSLNPLIYAWKFRDFRYAYRKTILTPINKVRRLTT